MVRQIIKSGLWVMGFITLSFGCYYDSEEDLYPDLGNCDTTNVTYSTSVVSILQFSCYSCHSNAQCAISGSGICLEGHTNLSGYITNNQVLFIDAIKQTGTASPMPKNGGALTSCEIQKIETWISDGMPNN